MSPTSLLWTIIAITAVGCRDASDFDLGAYPDAAPTVDAPVDVAIDPVDGAPKRLPCTETFGSALSPEFGRLDGILVSIVKPGTPGCSSDTHHLHLQIAVAGSVYDVAVNVDGDISSTTHDLALATPWSEGWHTHVSFDYAAIGAHSADFTTESPAALVDDLANELAVVNHITIYSTGYSASGTHLVHRNHGGTDEPERVLWSSQGRCDP